MVTYKWHYKCARCHRPIKTGEEVWLAGQPYGKYCYEVVLRITISVNDMKCIVPVILLSLLFFEKI